MVTLDQVELARSLAKVAHREQRRWNGNAYFTHLQAVAQAVGQLGADYVVVAYLHDIVEDTPVTEEALAALFPELVVDDVAYLTRLPGESYSEYVDLLVRFGSIRALQVKLADLRHNLQDGDGAGSLTTRYLRTQSRIRAELESRGVEPVA